MPNKTEKLNDLHRALWRKYQARARLSGILIAMPFMLDRAIKIAEDAERCRDDFWGAVRDTYPVTDGASYDYLTNSVTWKNTPDDE